MDKESANSIPVFSRIRVSTGKGEYEGLLLGNNDYLSLKLDNGYNIGIDYKNIIDIKVLGEPITRKKEEEKTRAKVNGKRILIIHTGGTIASRVDYDTGAVHPSYNANEILLQYPEITSIAPIETVQVSNILSEDLRYSHINSIAKSIVDGLKDDDIIGIIVTHGTDTMHYTSSALGFMLSRINKPIIITGSQRSSDRPSSDSRINLLCSAYAIKNYALTGLDPGIFLCMHEDIKGTNTVLIDGMHARKNHSSRRDAFKSINKPIAAIINMEDNIIERNPYYNQHPSNNEGPIEYKPIREDIRIGILKSHPNMTPEDIKMYYKHDGIIIEGTGFGHIGVSPDIPENNSVYDALRILARRKIVFMSKQTIGGVTNMQVYSAGRRLKDIGILGDNTDCTSECAFMKLAFLLSNYDKKTVKKLMNTNLRGEYNDYREVY